MSVDRDTVSHWETTWRSGPHEERGWFQSDPQPSLDLVLAHTPEGGHVVDVGGGASLLVDRLLDAGREATIVDVAEEALAVARRRLGTTRSGHVRWVRGDVTALTLDPPVDTWHDRAVLHFLLEEEDRRDYVASLRRSLRPGGTVVIGTFAPDGPETCSGLPVRRHRPSDVVALLGDDFEPVEDRHVLHTTPGGGEQAFTFVVLARLPARA